MRIDRCNNIGDFRSMARRRLPGPIFHYIDGAADDEVTYRRNTEAYERCDLVPNVLAGVESIDMSITVMGQKIDMPLFCAPTALQRLFHHDGERAVAKAAEKFGTMFGISSLGTISIEEIGSTISTPKLFQLYFHKDRGLTNSMKASLGCVGTTDCAITRHYSLASSSAGRGGLSRHSPGLVFSLVQHHRPSDARRLVRQRNGDHQRRSPPTQPDHPRIGFRRFRSQQIGACPINEQPPQITVAALRDTAQPGFPTG